MEDRRNYAIAHPDDALFIILDAMDQNKTNVPSYFRLGFFSFSCYLIDITRASSLRTQFVLWVLTSGDIDVKMSPF